MRPSSSLSSSSGRTTPSFSRRPSVEPFRPPGSRGYPNSPTPKSYPPRSRPGSSLGSRPSTPAHRSAPETYSGSIQVSIRPNPGNQRSGHVTGGTPGHWDIDEYSNTIKSSADGTTYNFDNVFPPSKSVTNRDVYNRSCVQLVNSFLHEGYNGTLFAYGMTGSGKTYSMRGEDHDPGFVRLAIDDIFSVIDTQNLSNSTKKHTLSAAYLEIYNEKIVDLLSQGGQPSQYSQLSDLKIRDDAEYGTKIVGIQSPEIVSKAHLLQLIKTGDTKRKTSATDYNARSSRSHAILQLRLHTVDTAQSTEQRCTLSLCDLAGSERATSSAERRKEGAFINKSLLALSTVINKLSQLSAAGPGAGTDHIPYRDSKLTRLLQPALSGNSLISILCTVHLGSGNAVGDQQCVTETNSTLRFAARAKDIVMDVAKNKKQTISMQDTNRIIDELRQTVTAQKMEIDTIRRFSPADSASPVSPVFANADDVAVASLRAEIKMQAERIEHLNRLNDLHKTETVLFRNDALNDILGVDVNIEKGVSQMMMSNLEEFYRRMNFEVEQHKAYVGHLEKQLGVAHQKIALQEEALKARGSQVAPADKGPSDAQVQDLLQEQEEEIWRLKETLKDKDHIISSLTKTSKLRRLVDSNQSANGDFSKRPSLVGAMNGGGAVLSAPLVNKENNRPGVREFNLSPTKATF